MDLSDKIVCQKPGYKLQIILDHIPIDLVYDLSKL